MQPTTGSISPSDIFHECLVHHLICSPYMLPLLSSPDAPILRQVIISPGFKCKVTILRCYRAIEIVISFALIVIMTCMKIKLSVFFLYVTGCLLGFFEGLNGQTFCDGKIILFEVDNIIGIK